MSTYIGNQSLLSGSYILQEVLKIDQSNRVEQWDLIKKGTCIIHGNSICIGLDMNQPWRPLKDGELDSFSQFSFKTAGGEELTTRIQNPQFRKFQFEYLCNFIFSGTYQLLSDSHLVYTPEIASPKELVGTNHIRKYTVDTKGMTLEKSGAFRFVWRRTSFSSISVAATS